MDSSIVTSSDVSSLVSSAVSAVSSVPDGGGSVEVVLWLKVIAMLLCVMLLFIFLCRVLR